MPPRSAEWGRRFEIPIVIAAVATVPVLIVEQHRPTAPWRTIVHAADWVIWSVFALELIVMLIVVPSRATWLRGHMMDVAIVLLTPPVLSVGIQSLRLLLILRLLRLVRLAPVMRRMLSLEGPRYAIVIALLTLVGGAEAFSAVERVSIGDSLYWALSTMTTVGYGDIRPHTPGGKIVACVVMVVGIGFFALITGAIAQRFLSVGVADTERAVGELEAAEGEVLHELQAITQRLARVEEMVRAQGEPGGPAGPGGGGTAPGPG